MHILKSCCFQGEELVVADLMEEKARAPKRDPPRFPDPPPISICVLCDNSPDAKNILKNGPNQVPITPTKATPTGLSFDGPEDLLSFRTQSTDETPIEKIPQITPTTGIRIIKPVLNPNLTSSEKIEELCQSVAAIEIQATDDKESPLKLTLSDLKKLRAELSIPRQTTALEQENYSLKLHMVAILADNTRVWEERETLREKLELQMKTMNQLHQERIAVVSQEVQNLRAIPEMRGLLEFITEVDKDLADAMLADHEDERLQAKHLINKQMDAAELRIAQICSFVDHGEPAVTQCKAWSVHYIDGGSNTDITWCIWPKFFA